MIHPDVGHLGIFVGSKTAKKEHMEIIKSIDIIEALAPGLYEMIIFDKGKKEGVSDYDVRFIERDIKDLMALNADKETMNEEDVDFRRVATVSEMNDWLYNTFVGPFVKMFSTETSAEIMKQLHPLRVNKYIFSDTINPFMWIFKMLAPVVKKTRSPVSPDNPFTALEENVSDNIVAILDSYQAIRDHFEETLFFAIYENPWMKLLYPEASLKKEPVKEKKKEKTEEEALIHKNKEHWYSAMEKGGYEEGIVRIVMALEDLDHAVDRDALYQDEGLLESSERLKRLNKKDFIHMARKQSRILQTDEDKAFKSLAKLIATPKDRKNALAVAKKIVLSGRSISKRQKEVLSKIAKALQIQ
jgi:Protein of unknown function (DUF3141)